MELLHHRLDFFFGLAGKEDESLHHVREVGLAIGNAHAVSHGIVEVRNGLTAVLVVLVTLYGNRREGRIAADVLRFTEMAVPRIEAVLEELLQVDLAARHGKGIEIQIVDVDIAFHVGAAMLGLEHHHRVEVLGRFATVLEHRTHGGIAVDVRVFALEVGFLSGAERDVAERVHEARVDFADAGTLGTVKDVALGRIGIVVVGKGLFDGVLDFFDIRLGLAFGLEAAHRIGGYLQGSTAQNIFLAKEVHLLLGGLDLVLKFTRCAESLNNGVCNLLDVERHFAAVALLDCKNHHLSFKSLN